MPYIHIVSMAYQVLCGTWHTVRMHNLSYFFFSIKISQKQRTLWLIYIYICHIIRIYILHIWEWDYINMYIGALQIVCGFSKRTFSMSPFNRMLMVLCNVDYSYVHHKLCDAHGIVILIYTDFESSVHVRYSVYCHLAVWPRTVLVWTTPSSIWNAVPHVLLYTILSNSDSIIRKFQRRQNHSLLL